MRNLNSQDIFERERDALAIATASDDDVVRLCRELGDDPSEVSEGVRQLLLDAVSDKPALVALPESAGALLPFPSFAYPELLPLYRILVVDDDAKRLAARIEEFRLHQFTLGFAIETAHTARECLAKMEKDSFDAVFIELRSTIRGTRWILNRLQKWKTRLPPVILDSVGMDCLELRRLNRNAVRALARGLGKTLPKKYRIAETLSRKGPVSEAGQFEFMDNKKVG